MDLLLPRMEGKIDKHNQQQSVLILFMFFSGFMHVCTVREQGLRDSTRSPWSRRSSYHYCQSSLPRCSSPNTSDVSSFWTKMEISAPSPLLPLLIYAFDFCEHFVETLWDPSGSKTYTITHVEEYKGKLYMGSLAAQWIAVYDPLKN